MLERTIRELSMLRGLIDSWPTNRQLRETKQHREGKPVPPPPEALPFNLDKSTDTSRNIVTKTGAIRELAQLREEWEHYTGIKDPKDPIGYLIRVAAKARETLPPALWDSHVTRIHRLTNYALTITGHGWERIERKCLKCGATYLYSKYLEDGKGISDHMVCRECSASWERGAWVRDAILYARYATDPILTQAEAAILLNEDVKTISARVKRRNLSPETGKGKGAKYLLSNLSK